MRETDWAPVSFVSTLAVEHPIVRVDTNDRVQRKPHVTSDVGPEALAEMVYRGMATGQRWGRGRRQAQGPVGSPYGWAQPPAGRPLFYVLPDHVENARLKIEPRSTTPSAAEWTMNELRVVQDHNAAAKTRMSKHAPYAMPRP